MECGIIHKLYTHSIYLVIFGDYFSTFLTYQCINILLHVQICKKKLNSYTGYMDLTLLSIKKKKTTSCLYTYVYIMWFFPPSKPIICWWNMLRKHALIYICVIGTLSRCRAWSFPQQPLSLTPVCPFKPASILPWPDVKGPGSAVQAVDLSNSGPRIPASPLVCHCLWLMREYEKCQKTKAGTKQFVISESNPVFMHWTGATFYYRAPLKLVI